VKKRKRRAIPDRQRAQLPLVVDSELPAVEKGTADPVLFFAVLMLSAFGLVMVYSSSAVFAAAHNGDSLYFFKRQLLALVIGLIAMVVAFRVGYRRLVRLAYPLLAFTAILLVLVLLPGFGSAGGGSARWIRFGSWAFQPGELAKIALIVYLAFSVTRKKENIRTFGKGFLPHLLVCAALIVLLLGQPDFGTAAIMSILLFLLLYVAGTRVSYIVVAALAAVPMAYGLITGSSYRMRRMLAFMDPWSLRFDEGYQISESLMSFGSGGLMGAGLGEGKHKLFFLPAAHTDFIYSIVGEELGLAGALAVILLFGIIVWRGMRAALRAPDLFGTYLAFGLTMLIGLQALINMGVVTSSLICTLLAVGILLDISAVSSRTPRIPEAKATWP
jgi:cell division protein FtsW